jgi:outer membrane receptor protein involved in Fe transport
VSATIRAAAIIAAAGLAVGPLSSAAATSVSGNRIAQIVAQATPPAQGNGTVTGTVTDTTGAPIAGAKIEATGASTQSTTSDAQGNYTLTLAPGVYSISASKGGYSSASQDGYAVLAGASTTLNVSLAAATFSSLRTIGRVSVSRGRSAFNTGPASIQTISAATYEDQGLTQVQQVLDQTPGIVIDHPGTSANNASPGAITFPSIRGGLGFETASLIDGHPLAVQTFGDYVTTFLNTDVLQSVEVIKGPGASSPTINYAINGTVNFRTLDPTANLTGQVKYGYDSYGGQQSNFRISDTVLNHKLGFVLDYALNGTPGPVINSPSYITPSTSWLINGGAFVSATTASSLTGVQNQIPYASSTALLCCQTLNENYNSKTELAKLQYHFSPSTVATVSYLGSQAYVDQNGAHLYEYPTIFSPSATYAGSLPAGATSTYQNTFFPNNFEWNNEPIFQGEIRTTLGRDSVLARYYAASINRLAYEIAGPTNVDTENLTLSGTLSLCPTGYNSYSTTTKLCTITGSNAAGVAPVTRNYNNTPVVITIPNANFTQAEEDKLHGGTFEYDHVIGDGGDIVSLSLDQVNANTDSYSGSSPSSYSYSIYGGEKIKYTSALARAIFNIGHLNVTLANYYNNYQNTYTVTGGQSFQTATFGRYDGRIGLAYRATPDIALRASVGSAVAPPYLSLLTSGGSSTIPTLDTSNAFATNRVNTGGLRPETAFGYDVGADIRTSADGFSTFSTDLYLNNVFNQFVSSSEYANGTTTVCNVKNGQPASAYTGGVCPANSNGTLTVPLLTTGSLNLSNARYMGVEVAAKRQPNVGFGYNLSGALIRAYPYNVNPCIYYTTVNAQGQLTCSGTPSANLAIVSGPNYYNSGTSLSFAVSNHSEPYAQGYASISYRTPRGGLLLFGEQYYGNNNSLNVPAFFRANATAKFPVYDTHTFVQASVSNLFNIFSNAYITPYSGNTVPLVNGKIGLTNANTIGPRFVQFTFTHNFGNR